MPVLPFLDEDKRRGTEILIRKKKKKSGKKRVAFDVHKAEKKERKKRREVFPANINLKPLFDASLELLTRTPCCL